MSENVRNVRKKIQLFPWLQKHEATKLTRNKNYMVTGGQYIFLKIMRIYMYVSKILIPIYQCLESFSHKVIFMIISSYHNSTLRF